MVSVVASPTDRSAQEVLTWSRNLVEPALRTAVDTLPGSMRRVTGYHLGWWDEDGNLTAGDIGKTLRPALVLLAAQAMGAQPTVAVPAAAAVELVHNFSLLHDDVMDGDVTRRHRPTAWRIFGISAAILAGDALLTLAFEVLADSGHPAAQDGMRLLSAAVQDLVDGQSADVSFERRSDVDLIECIRMAERKTGALLGCACAIGGLFAGASRTRRTRLGAFGAKLGLAFQFVDDLLGIWGDPEATGKPVYSDLHSRKKSLPVVAALTSDTPAAHELAGLYAQPKSTTDLEELAGLVESTGARTWSQDKADELLTQALTALALADPAIQPGHDLTALAELMVHRDH